MHGHNSSIERKKIFSLTDKVGFNSVMYSRAHPNKRFMKVKKKKMDKGIPGKWKQ